MNPNAMNPFAGGGQSNAAKANAGNGSGQSGDGGSGENGGNGGNGGTASQRSSPSASQGQDSGLELSRAEPGQQARQGGEPAGQSGLWRSKVPTTGAVLPAVDIFEDAAGVTILADLPGVSRERLGVRVSGDSLTIEGAALPPQGSEPAQDMEIIYGEVLNPVYLRNFTLSRDLDASRIEASLNQGVLKLVIPKSEQAKSRRIDVKVG